MANCFWFYSILAGWSTWEWVILNFSQNFWPFDALDTPGCASAVFDENEIWNRLKQFLPVCIWMVSFIHEVIPNAFSGHSCNHKIHIWMVYLSINWYHILFRSYLNVFSSSWTDTMCFTFGWYLPYMKCYFMFFLVTTVITKSIFEWFMSFMN